MNIYQGLALAMAAAFGVLAFWALVVLGQRNRARANESEVRHLNNRCWERQKEAERKLADHQLQADERIEVLKENNRGLAAQLMGLKETERESASCRLQANARIDALERSNRELAARLVGRNVTWVRPAKRMPAKEVKRAFAVDPTAPLWMALQQEIDDFIMDKVDEVEPPPSATMTSEQRTHAAGGLWHVRDLQKRLLELHAAAQAVDEDLANDDEKSPQGGAA